MTLKDHNGDAKFGKLIILNSSDNGDSGDNKTFHSFD